MISYSSTGQRFFSLSAVPLAAAGKKSKFEFFLGFTVTNPHPYLTNTYCVQDEALKTK